MVQKTTSETQSLSTLNTELDLNNWWKELLGQNPSPETFDIYKAIAALPRTEVTAAEEIQRKFKNRLSYVPTENRWYAWDGRVHAPCEGDAVATMAVKSYYRAMVQALDFIKSHFDREALKVASSGIDGAKEKAQAIRQQYDKGEISKHKNFRDRVATNAGINAVATLYRVEAAISAEYFADDRRWIVVENGVFDMEAVRRDKRFNLLSHDADRPVFRYLPMTDSPGADYPALRGFLKGSIADEGQARFYSKITAHAFLGAPVKTKAIVSMQGAPNSGKSMINRIMQRMAGSFYTEPNANAIIAGGRNPDHARHCMKQARYVGFTEVTERLNRQFILEYTGGDEIKSEQKYVNQTEWRPQGIIFMSSNYGMDVDRSDAAMYSRLYPVQFPHTFEKNHVDPALREDEELENKIVAESSGFLEWLKWGYLTYLEEGIDRTDSMEHLRRTEAAEDEFTVAQYVKDRIESGFYTENYGAKNSEFVGVTTAFLDYKSWCEAFDVPRDARVKRSVFREQMTKDYPVVPYKTDRYSGLISTVHS